MITGIGVLDVLVDLVWILVPAAAMFVAGFAAGWFLKGKRCSSR